MSESSPVTETAESSPATEATERSSQDPSDAVQLFNSQLSTFLKKSLAERLQAERFEIDSDSFQGVVEYRPETAGAESLDVKLMSFSLAADAINLKAAVSLPVRFEGQTSARDPQLISGSGKIGCTLSGGVGLHLREGKIVIQPELQELDVAVAIETIDQETWRPSQELLTAMINHRLAAQRSASLDSARQQLPVMELNMDVDPAGIRSDDPADNRILRAIAASAVRSALMESLTEQNAVPTEGTESLELRVLGLKVNKQLEYQFRWWLHEPAQTLHVNIVELTLSLEGVLRIVADGKANVAAFAAAKIPGIVSQDIRLSATTEIRAVIAARLGADRLHDIDVQQLDLRLFDLRSNNDLLQAIKGVFQGQLQVFGRQQSEQARQELARALSDLRW
jgi:hypothetical protein